MQIIYFLPSFLSVLSVEYPPSGWWNCQSYRDWDDFFPYIARIVSIRKNKTPAKCSCHAKNILKINSKQLLFWTQLTDSLKLMFGRRYQEIWKKKCLTFRFVIWKYPAFIFSSCRIWSEFITGTIAGAKCYLTKLSHPWKAISIFLHYSILFNFSVLFERQLVGILNSFLTLPSFV